MYEAGISLRFTASHRLRGNFGPARELHSHDYRLDVTVRGTQLNPDGVLVDITVLEAACRKLTASFEGRCLDEVSSIAGINTTMEALAARIHTLITPALESVNGALRITVWESPDAWGAFEKAILTQENASH